MWLAAAVVALNIVSSAGADTSAETTTPGVIHPSVACHDFPAQSYALYLPAGYPAGHDWPVLYCFDPAARGPTAVERFRVAAERHGFIVAASNNSRNGSWLRSHAAADAMLRDTLARLRIDRRLCFAAGFSGGARVACRVAEAGDFAGVVACGAGFSQGAVPAEVPFAFFGTAGREDFNYQEMRRTDAMLATRGAAHRLVLFDGGHEWPPEEVAVHALEWMRLHAMRSGLLPRDDAWIHGVFTQRMQIAARLREDGPAWLEYSGLHADFAGLVDTRSTAERAASLEKSRATRRFVAAEKKAARAEERWNAELDAAVADVLAPPQSEAPKLAPSPLDPLMSGRAIRRPRGAMDGFAGATDAASEGWDHEPFALDTPAMSPTTDRRDPLAEFRALVRDLERRGRNDPAARRVLSGTFTNVFSSGHDAMDGRDFAEAARRFEIAALINPDDQRPHFDLARAYAAAGQRAKAQRSLDAATTKGYTDRQRLEELAQALANKDASVAELEPFVVRDLPALATSFGMSLIITADPETRQILRITIHSVARDSEAEARGLGQGAVIVSANGRSVRTLSARFTRDSEFHRLFMERRVGDTIQLDVIQKPGEPATTLTLTHGRDASSVDRPWTANSW